MFIPKFYLFCIFIIFSHRSTAAHNKKSWNISTISSSKQFTPNFEQDYPQFTPFKNEDFINFNESFSDEQSKIDQLSISKNDLSTSGSTSAQGGGTSKFQERIRPLKQMVLDLYKTYKTSQNNSKNVNSIEHKHSEQHKNHKDTRKKNNNHDQVAANSITDNEQLINSNIFHYDIGPGVNVTLDKKRETVRVQLDENCLKDVFEGRGKKFDLISKILPLFILPFLIQSAIVPFMITAIKILLVKSIMVGKIAIFLLLISAFKNHIKHNYDVHPPLPPPGYYVDPPSRRSEYYSSTNHGYPVEGNPSAWVN